MPSLAPRIPAVPGSGIRRIFELALQLDTPEDPIVMLAVGEPDVPMAPHIAAAAIAAWERDETDYTANAGIPALRQAIVAKLARDNDIHVDIDQVWATIGATQGLNLAMQMTLSSGDEVLVPDPGYTTFTMNAHMLDVRRCRTRSRPSATSCRASTSSSALVTPKTRVLIVNSPSNPLGAVYDRDDPRRAARLREPPRPLGDQRRGVRAVRVGHRARQHGEHRHREPGAERLLALEDLRHDRGAGRLLVVPPGLALIMRTLQEASISCVAAPDQYAAIAAIEGDQSHVDAAREHYRANFEAVARVLDDRGIRYLRPRGTFYLWVDVGHASGGDVAAWAEHFLRNERVAVAPGSAFGRSGEGWIRICLAATQADVLAGVGRLPIP